MEEKLLQYIWKNRVFPLTDYHLVTGEKLEIVSVGEENLDSGPDFFNAKIKINNVLWIGSIEIHKKSSDWLKHRHSGDSAYDNVVLHVVYEHDVDVKNSKGEVLRVFELNTLINKSLESDYRRYIEKGCPIICEKSLADIDQFRLVTWLDRMVVNRLDRRTEDINRYLEQTVNNKEQVFYELLAKAFGFKINALPMQMIAQSLPLSVIAKQHDSCLQIEAMFFGQAGLLEPDYNDEYPKMLQKEYNFLKRKYNLSAPCTVATWKFAKMYPSGFPTIRLSQLANLMCQSHNLFSEVMEANHVKELVDILSVKASSYWDTHYQFDVVAKKQEKKLGKQAIYSLIINTILPFVYAYATWMEQVDKKNKVLELLESMPAEENTIVRKYQAIHSHVKNALHSQALIELYQNYCNKKNCLHCGIGIYLLKARANCEV